LADALLYLLPARLRDPRLLRDQISWAARLSWLRPAAPVQRRSALLAGEDLWTLEHGDSHQLLVFLPLVVTGTGRTTPIGMGTGAGARALIRSRAGCINSGTGRRGHDTSEMGAHLSVDLAGR